jgi:hypothetical protein
VQLFQDDTRHAFDVIHHLPIPKTQNGIALRLEEWGKFYKCSLSPIFWQTKMGGYPQDRRAATRLRADNRRERRSGRDGEEVYDEFQGSFAINHPTTEYT